ncbi:MAG: BatA domain-containing protein [Thermogutta sp.]
MWLAPWFLIGGLLASLGVVLIHFMHRRRYRVVHWAAMEFLLQTSRRNRRMIELRDWLLMLLRVVCLSLFAIGMARPHWGNHAPSSASSAVHLVVMIDNSMSMGYKVLGRSLLDDAKEKAKDLIRALSPESRVTVIPFPDPAGLRDFGVLCSGEEARDLIDGLNVVDQKGDVAAALQDALQICARFAQPKQKRIVLISDMQRTNFPSDGIAQLVKKLPSPIEFVHVQPPSPSNTWIESLSCPDRFLLPGAETRFRVRIRHEGSDPRPRLPVQLSVRGQKVAVQTVDLVPGQTVEVIFSPYVLERSFQREDLDWMDVEASILSDGLTEDDRFALVVPVFRTFPLVFVDQFGQKEDPRQNLLGETYFIRKFLAATFEEAAESASIRAYTLDQINRDLLSNCRALVLAGIRDPREKLSLLAEYVRLGGNLVIFADGEFDPVAWNQTADDPYCLLPGRLEPLLAGRPASLISNPLTLFQIDPQSLIGEWFYVEGMNKTELIDLYRSVYFFQVAQLSSDEGSQLTPAGFSAKGARAENRDAQKESTDSGSGTEIANWLLWRRNFQREEPQRPPASTTASPASAGDNGEGRVPGTEILARFTNGRPFMATKSLGLGRVYFVSGGLSREWSTVSASYAIVVFDRFLRSIVENAVSRRNLETWEGYRLVVDDPHMAWHLIKPDGQISPISVGAIGGHQFGIDLQGFSQRGLHRLVGGGPGSSPFSGRMGETTPQSANVFESRLQDTSGHEEILLGIRGPLEESVLEYFTESELKGSPGESGVASLTSGLLNEGRNREWWAWFVAAALVGLLVELGWLSGLRSRNEVIP